MYGIILKDNTKMVGLARNLGFTMESVDADEYKAIIDLNN
jgi:hypothetical protein